MTESLCKGIGWNTRHEVDFLRALNGTVPNGQPRLDAGIHAIEAILRLAAETNGEVAVKARQALKKFTRRRHAHLAVPKEDEKIRYREIQAQLRKIISSPAGPALCQQRLHKQPSRSGSTHLDPTPVCMIRALNPC